MSYEQYDREEAVKDEWRSEATYERTYAPDTFDYIEQLAADYLSYAPGYPIQDWRKPPRPKSASYMRPRCRVTPDGSGGAPLQRPTSAPAGGRRRQPKTERWRESGMTRWPKESDKMPVASEASDGDPLRRLLPSQQPDWTSELWKRSLRRPGVDIQDPVHHEVGQRGVRELHEEWRDLHEEWQTPRPYTPQATAPRRPQSARAGSFRGSMPYAGATVNSKVALPRRHNIKAWVERPVSTGKMSLTHFGGRRYHFCQKPRGLEWDEYVQKVDPSRT